MALIKMNIPCPELNGLSVYERYTKFAELLASMMLDNSDDYAIARSGYFSYTPEQLLGLGLPQGNREKSPE